MSGDRAYPGRAPDTLPRLLRRNATTMAGRPAIREKTLGIWQTFTWAEYRRQVDDFALGLAAHGFRRGDKLAVIGDNRPRLYWAQLAAQCLGGIAVPMYQDAIASEMAYVLHHAEIRVVVAEDQEQVDKILSLKARLPDLDLIVFDDPRGMRHYPTPALEGFDRVQEAGREFAASHPGYVEAEIDRGADDDVALLTYTSGTTGNPKGVMLSHANLLAAAEGFVAAEDIRPTDDILSYLPMAWIGESLFSLVLTLLVGFTCNCPERPETVQRDLRELGPTVALAPPRIWENMLTQLRVRAADASAVKRRTFEFFRRLAERVEAARGAGELPSLAQRLGLMAGEILVYGPVRDQLGLRRTRWAYTGGAPLGPDTYRFFRAFGINLKQVWGSTELSGLAALQRDGEADPDTVGPAIPGSEIRIAHNGEVLVRSGAVFRGYYKQPEATREAVDDEGWFRTGDCGFIDGRGHLVIVDRARDVGKLADGTPFAPQFVENKLKFSPYIAEAVAFGDERPFVAAMIAIDLGTVGNWAERHNLAYTSFQDLSAKPEIRGLIGDEIARCNASLPAAAHIRRFMLLGKEFDADDNEITRTRKVRRRFIAEKYATVIEAFYGEGDEVELAAEITYEDGRKGRLDARIAIDTIAGEDMPARAPVYA
ncbi:MAG TPA: AMP-binding protein [Stellaceae bacterium]|nr:AMP-binding protein [Stellaceae bacterium]